MAVTIQILIFQLSLGPKSAVLFASVPVLGTIASVIGRRPESIGEEAKPRDWRNAAANAGIPMLLAIVTMFDIPSRVRRLLVAIIVATLATALSDTMSHELGAKWGGPPRLITSFRRVMPGTSGAVSAFGSVIAVITVFAYAGAAAFLELMQPNEILAVGLAASFGNAVDSVLGATIEARRWVNNHLVNFASVLSAAVFAWILLN